MKGKGKKEKTHFVLPSTQLEKSARMVEAIMEKDEFFRVLWNLFRVMNVAYLARREQRVPVHEVKMLCAYFIGIGMGRAKATKAVMEAQARIAEAQNSMSE